ncbi:Hypothetical predicted protein [Paramuricea clavata]|nr:Hypothetical predicted protein [Paramuricea clavata]
MLFRKSQTIVHFSVESFSSAISFSYITWQNSSGPTAFNVHMSKVTFQHCTLEHVNFQFTGLNTNLLIQNTAVSHCSSQSTEIPLFFMQILYNYSTSIFIQNSTFSYNKSPIIYAMQFQEIFMEDTLFLKNGKDISSLPLLTVSGSSVVLKNSIFNHTLGTSIEVKNVKNFKASKVVFLSNNGSIGSCLVVKRHSNVSLVDTIFKQNTNPVVFVKDNDGINILLKTCSFGCIQSREGINLPFLKASSGSNITATNCSIAKSCSVHCNNGELVKSNLYCEKCQPGSFSYDETNNILSDSCRSCPEGTYTSSTGSTNCSLCGEGTYAPKSG